MTDFSLKPFSFKRYIEIEFCTNHSTELNQYPAYVVLDLHSILKRSAIAEKGHSTASWLNSRKRKQGKLQMLA